MPEYRTTPQNIEDNRLYRYYRNQWMLAGTDNFTQPPAENQDMFESLLNILPPTNNVLQRRWGYRTFFPKVDTGGVGGDESFHTPPSTPVATIKARNMYSYENHTLNERTLIGTVADGTGVNSLTNNVAYWDVNNNLISIYTPAVNAINPRAVNSRDYEYFVDGVSGDQKAFNIANGTSKWGIASPNTAVSVAATSGSNASWNANTIFLTMGLIVDQNGNMEQLTSVNATQTNTSTTIGKSGVGQPAWNQTPGGTTIDTPVTWTNRGPIGLWQANHFFNEGHFGTGTLANPAIIYDNTTKALFFNNQGGGGTSGNIYPAFKTGTGLITQDGTVRWEFLGFVQTATQPGITAWAPSTSYQTWGATNNFSNSAVVEPVGVIFDFNPLTNSFNETIYLQSSTTGGTTPASETNPFFVSTAGQYSEDNQLRWLCLGSATWPANTAVTAWVPQSTNFSAIKDSNGNLQVCIQSGTTAGSQPTWALGYGHTTNETSGTAVWTNVGNGTGLSWAASTLWNLPTNGFTAPQTPTAYGGASIADLNNNLETVINSGKSGGSAPTWAAIGSNTADGGTALTLTQVTVSGGSTTYTGTITGGGTNAFAGFNFYITGFTNAGNNGIFNVVSSTTTTLVVNTTTQVNETHAGTATPGLIWFDVQTLGLGAGQITLITAVGRRYYVVYLNSTKQNFSDLSPISTGTGPITNGQVALFNIPISGDPQVDSKVILATADGGNPNTLYFVGQIANTTTSFNDNTPDVQLVLGNVYSQIDNNGNIIGVIGNQPPPNGSFPILHKGRVYMIVGTQLFFSKALSDVTTSTGIIAGRYEEDWPLTFAIDYSPGAENGIGLLSDGYALYIGTEKHIRRLLGDGPSNFQQPNVIFSETGLMTQNVWKVVFLEGTPIGSMWVTPDFRVIGSDFNSYNDVGTPIQTTLNTINPAAAQNAWAESITYGPYNFYVLAIPTGSNTDPDTVCVYDLHLRKWYVWQYADKFISGIFYISIAGTPRAIFVDNSGFVRFIDTTAVLDRNQSTETAVGISNTIKTAWLDLGDPSLRKTMNEIELATSNTGLLVTIEGASNQADFTTPNIVIQNAPLVPNIFGQLKTFLSGLPAIYRYYRFTFTGTSTAQSLTTDTILGYFSAEVLPLNRI